jgi:FdrA protein
MWKAGELMASGFVVRKNQYYDSVFLMGINKILSDHEGVEQTAVFMASEANKSLLTDMGIQDPEINAAQPNDLIVAVIATSGAVVEEVLGGLNETLKALMTTTPVSQYRTFEAGLEQQPDANLAVLSIPGEFVPGEACKALEAGLHAFIFSSNVPIEEEIALKQLGQTKGLLVMGPDCGTSIIGGAGIGFANVVRRGSIGVVGPSGTGLQEFTSMVHNSGAGISHAIGTGSNDLSDEIGGITMLMAIEALAADPGTEVITAIAKPPGAQTLERLVEKMRDVQKPLIGCFLGADPALASAFEPFSWARTIDDAVQLAIGGRDLVEKEMTAELGKPGWTSDQKFLRGVFAGGTFCYQTQQVLGDAGISVHSNGPLDKTLLLDHPDESIEHTIVDMGDEHYTLGKLHPMIDGSERAKRIIAEGQDPQTAILLLDFILGYNASRDPVGELLGPIQEAKMMANQTGGELKVVASICGTDGDPQELEMQVQLLREAGVIVFHSSARAAAYCRDLLLAREENGG